MIPNDVQDPSNEYKNLATQYGKISFKKIRSFEKTYIDTPLRAVQDFHMIYKFIMNSLLVEAKTKVNICSKEYSIGSYKSGNILLKVVTRESHLDTNATTSQIMIQLRTLDDLMATCVHDISKFNGNGKVLLDLLKARGDTKIYQQNNFLRDTSRAAIKYSLIPSHASRDGMRKE